MLAMVLCAGHSTNMSVTDKKISEIRRIDGKKEGY